MNFFKRFGLYKIRLPSLIFTSQFFFKVEVKRFFRKRKEYLAARPQESDASKEKSNATTVPSTSRQTLRFGSIEFQRPSIKNTRPWEQAKYG